MTQLYLSPVGSIIQALSNLGVVLAGGSVSIYQAATSTPITTYVDSTAVGINTQPIALNSAGRMVSGIGALVSVWVPANTPHRCEIKDSTGTLVAGGTPLDFLYGINDPTFIGIGITPGEIAAGLTAANLNLQYLPGDLRRYQADNTGTNDSSTAIQNAFNANVYVFGGGAGNVYKYASNIALTRDIVFDGQGCTLRPVTSAEMFRNLPAADITTTATIALNGSLTVTVASATGLAIGQEVVLNSQGNNLPYFWAVIKNIAGLVITLDRPIGPVDYINNTNSTGTFAWQATHAYVYGDFVTNGGNIYFCAIPGTSAGAGGPTGTTSNVAIPDNGVTWVYWGAVNFLVYNSASTLAERCYFRNVDWDGSLFTAPGANGMTVRAGLYKSVRMEDMRFRNFSVNANNQPVLLGCYWGLDCKVRGNLFEENQLWTTGGAAGEHVDIQGYRTAVFEANTVDGSGFGCDITYCDIASVTGNVLHGRKSYERSVPTALPFSARGIKGTRCGDIAFSNNVGTDYESPFRTDQGIRATFKGNKIRNADVVQGAFTNTSGIALNCSSGYNPIQRYYTIEGNTIENAGGAAIGINSGVGVFSGRHVIKGNVVRGCNAAGIYVTDSDNVIEGNRVENWDRSATGWGGIHQTAAGQTIVHNRFNHETDATRYCINTLTYSTQNKTWEIWPNIVESANPFIQGGYVAENIFNTTIASGTTTQVLTHNLLDATHFTPDATMVQLTPTTAVPTNHPRQVAATTFTATQFTVATDADPGAGGLAVAVRIRVPQPFKY
jgi:parallel beta-helix repeat protein